MTYERVKVDELFLAGFHVFDVGFVADFEKFDLFAFDGDDVAWFDGEGVEEDGDAVEGVAFFVRVEGGACFHDAAELLVELLCKGGQVSL